MAILIHVGVPLSNIDAVQAEIKRCCAETGDIPIGRRFYKDVEEELLVVQLIEDFNVSKHTKVLNQALQQSIILSFQFERTNLITVKSSGPSDIYELMTTFPLQPNDSWFPSIADPQMVYFCTKSTLLTQKQTTWLEKQHLDYQYL